MRDYYQKIIDDINAILNNGLFRAEIPINIVYVFKIKNRTEISYKYIVNRIEEMSQTERGLILENLLINMEKHNTDTTKSTKILSQTKRSVLA